MIPTILFIRLYAIILIILGQNTIISTASSCECRPSQQCRANPVPCSVNVDCECLLMTMTVGGMCAQYFRTSIGTTSISSGTTAVPTTSTTTTVPTTLTTMITSTPTTSSSWLKIGDEPGLYLLAGCTGQLFNCRWAPDTSSFNGTPCTPYRHNTSFTGCMPNETLITFDDYTTTCSDINLNTPYVGFLWLDAGIVHASLYSTSGYATVT
ncbi:unnamed protein product [Rotaria magnacalcarata]|uniref:Uncharacterized protein n=1 Tax=Rotaria magnacalcarata TaxID=392030 RepID=A0A816XEY0_9BILA|nr:unnamed protein product [Rotaria magnacalcarata]